VNDELKSLLREMLKLVRDRVITVEQAMDALEGKPVPLILSDGTEVHLNHQPGAYEQSARYNRRHAPFLMPDGSLVEQPAYMSKPQGQWTEEECNQHAAFQETHLKMQRAAHQPGADGQ
jgi:hypothetical protein